MLDNHTKYYEVLLPIPKSGIFTYSSNNIYNQGERVSVPIGKRTITGIILKESEKPSFTCKNIIYGYDRTPLFTDKWITFIEKLSEYYGLPIGLTFNGIISQKLLQTVYTDVFEKKFCPLKEIKLTSAQKDISSKININGFSRHLIHGITGSGKTEIYLEIAKRAIASGKQVMYIVPEISLTPQLTERIASRLGYMPPVFHSKLSIKKRAEAFYSYAEGEANLIIGARSTLFIPAKSIGLIIIDEEHEHSFKQEDMPPYHLRDMAVLYASILNIPIVMGSATPSVESMYNAMNGKYILHKISERPKQSKLPDIEIIDMKKFDLIENVISEPLYDKIYKTIKKGEQAVLFLNRKGYATSLFCKRCGEPVMCSNCSVGLVYYKEKNVSSCRYCGANYYKIICKSCGSNEFFECGAGTEKIAEFMENMFPGNVLRLDMENSSSIKNLSNTLKLFEKREAQILVGTQLVAKGLHFPYVTFVGILGIDNILALPDFRASERAYQLLVQVSGRAGREDLKGSVYIQTMMPETPILQFVKSADADSFYKYELKRREKAGFPPYIKFLRLILSHTKADKCREAATFIAETIKNNIRGIYLLGPVDADIFKIKNRNRVSILLKSHSNYTINEAINVANLAFEKIKYGNMMLKIDKDPYFMN